MKTLSLPGVTALIAALAVPAHADDARTTAIRIEAKDTDAAKRAVALQKAMRAVAKAKVSANAIDTAVAAAECKVLQPACAAAVGAKLAVTHMDRLRWRVDRLSGRRRGWYS